MGTGLEPLAARDAQAGVARHGTIPEWIGDDT